jgi:transposase
MFRCKDCNTFFLENIDYGHYIQNLTDQTILYIIDELRRKQSFKEIALRSNVSSQTVINIFEKYIDCPRGKLPEYICIDEFCYEHKKEGNKYACIIIDFLTSEIIDIIPSRRHSFLLPYINNHYSNFDKSRVKYVISDMYEGYEYLSKSIPKLSICR